MEERPLNFLHTRLTLEEDLTILAALHILRSRFQRRDVFNSPSSVMHFLRLQAQGLQHEVFGVMYLDTHHRLINYEQLFRGTLNQASVYPREVTRQALAANAASVILHHNHPSGDCLPSPADEALTLTLKAALGLVDIRVLDHIITSDSGAVSMRESGVSF
ncbi:MAG: JAB domain-containing protein [Pseudomonadota bacterium]